MATASAIPACRWAAASSERRGLRSCGADVKWGFNDLQPGVSINGATPTWMVYDGKSC